VHLCWTKNRVLRIRNKSWTNHPKHILEKSKKFHEDIENRKQLERFPGCLTYALNFIKDLAKLRKPLQRKLMKEISWIWTSSDTKIVQNFEKRCKNLYVLNLPNEENDFILETDASNKHWIIVLKIETA